MKLKLKAYTLFEIIISMVIMSVISLIVFVLFSSFLKQLSMYNETSTKIANYAFFKNNLKREFFLSNATNATTNTLDMTLNDSVSVSYLFLSNYTIKKMHTKTDTIFIKLATFKTKKDTHNNITQLDFDFLVFDEHLLMLLNKEYANNININSNFIDEN